MLKERQYQATQFKKGEPSFWGFSNLHMEGKYHWVICDTPLFDYEDYIGDPYTDMVYPVFGRTIGNFTFEDTGIIQANHETSKYIYCKNWDAFIGEYYEEETLAWERGYDVRSSSLWFVPDPKEIPEGKKAEDYYFYGQGPAKYGNYGPE